MVKLKSLATHLLTAFEKIVLHSTCTLIRSKLIHIGMNIYIYVCVIYMLASTSLPNHQGLPNYM